MRTVRCVHASMLVAGILLWAPAPASAQDSPQAVREEIDRLRRDFEALKQEYGQRLTALEQKLATADAASGQAAPAAPAPVAAAVPAPAAVDVPSGAQGAGGPSGALPVYGATTASSKIFNPDIAVIGDFLGSMGKNPVTTLPSLEMHESEASFQAVVDPYARADFFISFGQEGVELEEGYMTFSSLPGGLLTKVGKMRAAFGKVNGMHNHIMPWTDRPLVTQNLVGGEDGIDDAGISVARLIPNPWLFLEATGQVFAGNSSDVFQAYRRTDLTYVGHVRAYHDVTENSNIDFGFSYAHGNAPAAPDGPNDLKSNLYGVDATFRWRPLQRSIYHSFVGRTEWIWTRRETQPDVFATPQGMYASGDYQFARRWFAGARYDRSQSYASDQYDDGGSFLITFVPSEFSQIRGQYRRINYATAGAANEFLFQFQFAIGAHGAHPF